MHPKMPHEVKVAQSCPTLCDPMDYTVHGILQARILEWVALPFSRGSSWSRNRTGVSCAIGRFLTNWAIREALYFVCMCACANVCMYVCAYGCKTRKKSSVPGDKWVWMWVWGDTVWRGADSHRQWEERVSRPAGILMVEGAGGVKQDLAASKPCRACDLCSHLHLGHLTTWTSSESNAPTRTWALHLESEGFQMVRIVSIKFSL